MAESENADIPAPILQVEGLSFRYRDAEDDALRGITWHQDAGQFTALVGPSGAGKTTFCRCLNRIIPHFHKGNLRGRVRVGGESIAGKHVYDMAPRIGMVFQDFESQLFSTNVRLEVAFGLENLGLPREEMEGRVRDALALVGLAGFQEREPAALSGGQKQRLSIAAVIALAPDLLIMDEPTTDLDPAGRLEVMRLAGRLQGRTAMIVTDHEVDDLAEADRIEVLADGRIVMSGGTREVFARPLELAGAGVRPPQVAELFARAGAPEIPVTVEEGLALWSSLGWRIRSEEKPAAAPAGEPLIAVENLSFAYPDGTQALCDVNLAVGEGEILAILGQNGCGKTTLAKHLNGLLAPSKGVVRWRGDPIGERRLSEMARHVGYVFQNPDHQIFAQTVHEEVEFGPKNFRLPPEETAERVRDTLAAVGLQGREADNPFTMTKGERQRVAVASVLAAAPEVIVLDEPTTGLDYRQQLDMMALVRRLHAAGRTVILITHSMWIAAEYARRCVVMADGRIIADGPTRQVFADEEVLARAHLRAPAITQFGNRLGFASLSVEELLGLVIKR
ncbi:MAG: ABC transporter ATP-binding protein [Armatimonadota bacterium]